MAEIISAIILAKDAAILAFSFHKTRHKAESEFRIQYRSAIISKLRLTYMTRSQIVSYPSHIPIIFIFVECTCGIYQNSIGTKCRPHIGDYPALTRLAQCDSLF